MTSKAVWSDIFTEVIEVIEHHMPVSHSSCLCRSIWPLPSCLIKSWLHFVALELLRRLGKKEEAGSPSPRREWPRG